MRNPWVFMIRFSLTVHTITHFSVLVNTLSSKSFTRISSTRRYDEYVERNLKRDDWHISHQAKRHDVTALDDIICDEYLYCGMCSRRPRKTVFFVTESIGMFQRRTSRFSSAKCNPHKPTLTSECTHGRRRRVHSNTLRVFNFVDSVTRPFNSYFTIQRSSSHTIETPSLQIQFFRESDTLYATIFATSPVRSHSSDPCESVRLSADVFNLSSSIISMYRTSSKQKSFITELWIRWINSATLREQLRWRAEQERALNNNIKTEESRKWVPLSSIFWNRVTRHAQINNPIILFSKYFRDYVSFHHNSLDRIRCHGVISAQNELHDDDERYDFDSVDFAQKTIKFLNMYEEWHRDICFRRQRTKNQSKVS